MEISLQLIGIVALAGLVSGIAGFGFGLVAMGVLIALLPVVEATVLVAVIGLFCAMLNLWTVRDRLVWRETWPPLVTTLPVQILGVYLLSVLDGTVLKAGVAVMVLFGCLVMLWQPKGLHLEAGGPWPYLVGVLGGVFGGALGMGGPPIVFYALLRGWDNATCKAVMSAYFSVTSLWRVGLLVVAGLATGPLLLKGLALLVPALAGLYLGTYIFRRLSVRLFRYAAVVVLAAMSVNALVH
ncbi:MAG: sulfite exporter TauE/SafE family protein [Anaerolineae bacterium]